MGAAERHIMNLIFKCHEVRLRHALLHCEVGVELGAAFNWQSKRFVLGTITNDALDFAIISTDRDRNTNGRV